MRRFLAVALCVVLMMGLAAACGAADPVQGAAELLALGEQYLLDLEYEQALAQFMKVIEIEPNAARAYLGAAEAHVGLGDADAAIAVLERGLAATGDADIHAMLDRLRAQSGFAAPGEEGAQNGEAINLTGQPPFALEDLEAWGIVRGMSIWDVQGRLGLDTQAINETIAIRAEYVAGGDTFSYPMVESTAGIQLGASPSEHGELVGVTIQGANPLLPEGPRGIRPGESMSEVLMRFAVHDENAITFAQTHDPALLDDGEILTIYEVWDERRGDITAWAYIASRRDGDGERVGYVLNYELLDGGNEVYAELTVNFGMDGEMEYIDVWFW